MKRIWPVLFFLIITFSFFSPFFLKGLLPIPSDTIVGLYHPFRDLYSREYPNGIPYKNFLITDPVRQQYPWRNLSIGLEKKLELPLWNPYNAAGSPLLANLQSAVFYPFNILFFILPFEYGWSTLIILQPLFAGIFMYIYLNNLKLHKSASILGGIGFAFSGFSVAWLEWGTVGHTGLWLPLVLLAIDKIMFNFSTQKISNFKFLISNNSILKWCLVFIFALVSSFFAGHLQTFFYLFLASIVYYVARWIQFGKSKKALLLFVISYLLFVIVTAVQWLPTLQLILQSARGVDQIWQKPGWFIPWQNIIQFIAPDFFGNPATLNYWGEFNYAEFIGYVGIFPLIMSIFVLMQRKDKKTFFYGIVLLSSIVFAFPTVLAELPFSLQIPFISTSQPTRLLFLTDFSLSVLAAFGFDTLIRANKKTRINISILLVAAAILSLWYFVFEGYKTFDLISAENISVAKRNLYLPTIFFTITATLLLLLTFLKNKNFRLVIIILLLILSAVDLLRFANKFTPFTKKEYLFPNTRTINFLQKQKGEFRIMTTDDRLLPPNFSAVYQLQSIDGYDPLYLLRYGELISASERGRPDISAPFGFNRIITPKNYESAIVDLIGVKYVLSLSELKSSKLKKVFQEGETRVYENTKALPRAFFVEKVETVNNKQDTINALFDKNINFKETAIVENWDYDKFAFASGSASVIQYNENSVTVSVRAEDEAFLVFTDTYYPTWNAKICSTDEIDCKKTTIYLTNYNFRGVVVPKGEHKVIFENSLL